MKPYTKILTAAAMLLTCLGSGNTKAAPTLAETPVSITARADGIRSAIRAIRSDNSLADILFLYEGNETEEKIVYEARVIEDGGIYLTASVLPTAPRPTLTFEEPTMLRDLLPRVASTYHVNTIIDEHAAAIIIQDAMARDETEAQPIHPLDVMLDEADAARDMSYLEALRLLDEKYAMNLPPSLDFSVDTVQFMCPCNDLPAWKATDQPVQVRDLLISVLKTANSYLGEHNSSSTAYQIKTFRGERGRPEYTIISF